MRGTKRNAHKLCPNIQLPNSVRWLVGWLALPCFTSNRRSFPNGAHYVADNIVVASNSTKIHSFVQYIYLFFPPNSHSKLINIKTELVSHNVGSAPCTMCAIQISMVRTFQLKHGVFPLPLNMKRVHASMILLTGKFSLEPNQRNFGT